MDELHTKAFFTGVTKFSKVSIFSDLHNLLSAYSSVPFGQTGVSVVRFVQDIHKGDGRTDKNYQKLDGVQFLINSALPPLLE